MYIYAESLILVNKNADRIGLMIYVYNMLKVYYKKV